MKLSVVMAVRNGQPYVREAIESVLAQSVTDFEFLIVNDASTDDTSVILSEYQNRDSRIAVLHNRSHLGPYPSANRALRRARGNIVARHDADDISPPGRFAIQLEALESGDDICLVTGAVEVFDGNSGQVNRTIRPRAWQPGLEWDLLFANTVGAGAHVMFPRVFKGAPILFPEEYFYAEDYGLWCRLSRLGRIICPAQIIYRYRQHALSISSCKRVEQDECASKIRREYQSQYLRSDAFPQAAAELSQFWTMADGSGPIVERACHVHSRLAEIRSSFLAYVGQRYGLSERALLEAELDETLRDRLGYWLFRSVRILDGRRCGDLLSLAIAKREALTICAKALGQAAAAFLRKLLRAGATYVARKQCHTGIRERTLGGPVIQGPASPAAESLTDRTARAATWRLAGSMVGAVSQFAVGVLLAHLLTPADFGLMALALVVLGLARPLGDLGIGSAVVQRAELTDRHVRTAFTFSVLLGLAITAAIAVAAPLGALVMRDPRMTSVLRVLAAGFAVGGTAVVAGALLRRRLDFKRQFFIDTACYVLGYGGVAAPLAMTGYGVWSLVWGGLAQTLLASCAQLIVVRHSVRPLLARRELEELLHFGLGAAANACVNYVALNADNFVVGRWIGVAGLGLYNRAYALMNLPYTYAASVMSSVLFPAFAEVQREPARVRGAYLLLTQLTAMVAAPAMGMMAIAAPHLVRSVYGPQWTGVVLSLQILCVAGYFRALYHLGGVVAQSVGLVYGDLRNQAVYAALVIGGALLGSHYGLGGVAAGVSVAILYMFVATGQLALRATGIAWGAYLRVQVGALVTAGLTCGVALFVRLLLEAHNSSSAVITLAVLVMAAVPWSVGLLWTLGEREFEPLRGRLPHSSVRLVAALRRLRRPFPGSNGVPFSSLLLR